MAVKTQKLQVYVIAYNRLMHKCVLSAIPTQASTLYWYEMEIRFNSIVSFRLICEKYVKVFIGISNVIFSERTILSQQAFKHPQF